ncbi:MAG: RsmD family RNA methyltransferase [Chloroflexi bacterium]|nr:RsmD family RNA methyltransferase [Chloroflexota bacterium]
MRVTGGAAGGTTLRSPKSPGVRPTTDLVRAALFNILAAYTVEDSRVIDLFAGTGAIGIEVFIELGLKGVDRPFECVYLHRYVSA